MNPHLLSSNYKKLSTTLSSWFTNYSNFKLSCLFDLVILVFVTLSYLISDCAACLLIHQLITRVTLPSLPTVCVPFTLHQSLTVALVLLFLCSLILLWPSHPLAVLKSVKTHPDALLSLCPLILLSSSDLLIESMDDDILTQTTNH